MDKLKISTHNTKLMKLQAFSGLKVVGFDLPAGWTCPSANICLARANKITGVITKGKNSKFLCYASRGEAVYKNVRLARWHNFDLLRSLKTSGMIDALVNSIPDNTGIVRIHASGDFYNANYFKAWSEVADRLTNVLFFGYTKVLPYVLASKPANMFLQYSHGGNYDLEASALNVPTCYVRTNKTDYIQFPTVCASKDTSHEDFYKILAKESFVIDKH